MPEASSSRGAIANGYHAGLAQSSYSSQRHRDDDYRRDYYDERHSRRSPGLERRERYSDREYAEHVSRASYRDGRALHSDEDDRARRRYAHESGYYDQYREVDARGRHEAAREKTRERERGDDRHRDYDSTHDRRSRRDDVWDDRDPDRRTRRARAEHDDSRRRDSQQGGYSETRRLPVDADRSSSRHSRRTDNDEPQLLRRTRWDTDSIKGELRPSAPDAALSNGAHDKKSDQEEQGQIGLTPKDNGASATTTRRSDWDDEDGIQQMWTKSQDKQQSSPPAKISPKQALRSLAAPTNGSLHESRDRKPTATHASPKANAPGKLPSLVERLGIDAVTQLPAPAKTDEPVAALPSTDAPEHLELESRPAMLARPDILLPHQLLLPENADKKPKLPDDKKVDPYRITYDPATDKAKAGRPLTRTSNLKHVTDPRDPAAKGKARRDVHLFKWKYDENSTGPKPPLPPRAVVVTGLSKLMTMPTVLMHFSGFGRIAGKDLKLDPSTGESTGIAYICFAHDYDERQRLLSTAGSKPQKADTVAKAARAKFNGQKIGSEVVTVILDDVEKTNYARVFFEMREAQKVQSQQRAAESARAQQRSQEDSRSQAPPTPDVRASARVPRPSELLNRPSQAPVPLGANARGRVANASRDDQLPRRSRDDRHRSRQVPRHSKDGVLDEDNFESLNSRATHSDAIHHGRSTGRHGAVDASRVRATTTERISSTESILKRLVHNNRPYVFIAMSRSSQTASDTILDSLRDVRPLWTERDPSGWYVAFDDGEGAARCEMFLANRSIDRFRVIAKFRTVRDARRELERLKEQRLDLAEGQSPASFPTAQEGYQPEKTSWTDEELQRDSLLLALYEIGDLFVRDVRTRTLKPFLSKFLQQDQPGGRLINTPLESKESVEDFADLEIDMDRPKTFNRARREEDRLRKIEEEQAEEEARQKAELQHERELAKASRAAKRNDKVAQARAKAAASAEAAKAAKKSRAASPVLDLEESGIVGSDDEDYYFVRTALEMMQRGESFAHVADDAAQADVGADEDWDEGQDEVKDDLPLHKSGSARTEGFYRVKPEDKAKHLPDRNRAVVDVQQASGLASARDNRADSRRFVQGIEQHKKETATDTDILKFNQLRSRKKQLKFAKSPIHDWGLYAMEMIPAGDMVIEYVGEIVRQQVADEREKNYERQGNFSTYLFRVDDDIVVDATKKGNIARLMNHCCTPNCNAKILTLNGEKRIVLYAQERILPGQELTYDYKFQGTGDDEDAIACLCGSAGCRRFL